MKIIVYIYISTPKPILVIKAPMLMLALYWSRRLAQASWASSTGLIKVDEVHSAEVLELHRYIHR